MNNYKNTWVFTDSDKPDYFHAICAVAGRANTDTPSQLPPWLDVLMASPAANPSLPSLFPAGPHPPLSRPYCSLHTQLTSHLHRKGTVLVCTPWLNIYKTGVVPPRIVWKLNKEAHMKEPGTKLGKQ